MKTVLGLIAVMAAGVLSPAGAQTMGPDPVSASSAANPPLASRTMVSQAFDPYFSGSATSPATTGSVPARAAAPAGGLSAKQMLAQSMAAQGMAPQSATSPSAASGGMASGGMAAPAGEGTPPSDGTGKLVSYSSAHVDGPYIAITFDDGPNPETTPKLLKLLKQRGIHATFFVLGSRAIQSPEILRQMVAEGHEIGNHSWSHPQLPKIALAKADQEIASTSDAIEKATGQKPVYLRPPYGEMTPALRDHLHKKYGLTFIYWSVDTLDWKNRDTQKIYDMAMKEVGRGGIILAHDIHATTVAAMPKLLDALLAKGYKFVTVSELIAMDKPEARVAALTPTPPKKPKPAGAAKTTKPSAKPVSAKPSSKPASAKPKPTMGLY